jgi:hypothetical protein
VISLPPLVTWFGGLLLAVGFAVTGIRFRRGASPQSLSLYRSDDAPAALRNLPLFWPLGVFVFATMLVVDAPDVFGWVISAEVPKALRVIGGALILSVILGGTGLMCVLGTRLPPGLVPPWLREADQSVGYVPRRMDWLDWLIAAFGVVAIGLAILFLGRGAGQALGLITA